MDGIQVGMGRFSLSRFWLALGLVLTSTFAASNRPPLAFGLSADVTPVSNQERPALESYLSRKAAGNASILESFVIEGKIKQSIARQKGAWDSVVPEVPARFTLNPDSRSTIAKVNDGSLQLAAVRGDILASLSPDDKKNLCIVGSTRHSDVPGRQFVVLTRKGHPLSPSSRLSTAGVVTPREAVDFLKQSGLAELPRAASIAAVSAEDGMDDLVDEKNRMEYAIVNAADWSWYRRMKPGRSSALEPVLTRGNYVVLSRLGEGVGEIADPAELQGKRVGIFPSGGAGFRPEPPIAPGTFESVEVPGKEADNAEDLLDDLVDRNGGDVTVLPRDVWEAYQRRKPGRASKLAVVKESPRVPATTVICNRNKMSASDIARVRTALTSRNASMALGGGLVSGVRATGFDVPTAPVRVVTRQVATKPKATHR